MEISKCREKTVMFVSDEPNDRYREVTMNRVCDNISRCYQIGKGDREKEEKPDNIRKHANGELEQISEGPKIKRSRKFSVIWMAVLELSRSVYFLVGSHVYHDAKPTFVFSESA